MASEPEDRLQIPGEMRDLAERSVEQARKAVDGMIQSARRAQKVAETSVDLVRNDAAALAQRSMQHAQQNIGAAFSLATAIAQAQTAEEVLRLQQAFLRSQMESLQMQAGDFARTVGETAKKVGKMGT